MDMNGTARQITSSEDYREVAILYTAFVENKRQCSPSTRGPYIRDGETKVILVPTYLIQCSWSHIPQLSVYLSDVEEPWKPANH